MPLVRIVSHGHIYLQERLGILIFHFLKGVRQGGILSPCLFNFYAEYIMRNAGLEAAQIGIKMQGEISITSDKQMTPPLWQKVKNSKAS